MMLYYKSKVLIHEVQYTIFLSEQGVNLSVFQRGAFKCFRKKIFGLHKFTQSTGAAFFVFVGNCSAGQFL